MANETPEPKNDRAPGKPTEEKEAGIPVHPEGARIAELTDALKRLQAEFENYRKRVEREKGELKKIANTNLLAGLLTIFDDFERVPTSEIKDEKVRAGIEMISANFRKILEDEGVKPVPVSGRIDPHMHEALMWTERDDLPEGTIVGVLQKGYLLNGRTLRPAKVSVSKKPSGAEKDDAKSTKNGEEGLK